MSAKTPWSPMLSRAWLTRMFITVCSLNGYPPIALSLSSLKSGLGSTMSSSAYTGVPALRVP